MPLPLFPHKLTAVRCRFCKAPVTPETLFLGPDMWHAMEPTCKHEVFVVCRDCYRDRDKLCTCSQCGCEEFYT